ncbi:MAG: hypothetical protein KatS3mg004_2920 [Bryobacteraceae bacterium]|nr:MAG: hypothetical protein KatS3mg004_2920 [Bryobacteraceae bacterium]
MTSCYDRAGRVKSVTGVKAGESARAYVSQASYDSGGGLDRALLGNGRWEDRDYNERKQIISIKLGSTQGAGDLLALGFGYGTTNNNGNVLSQTITRPGFSATQTYTYDAYNRIQKVQEGTDFREFAYKEPGNLYVPSWSTGAGWAPGSFTPASPSWFDGNNRMVNTGLGIGYDAAGNQTAIGGFAFVYDAENRLVSSTLNGVTTTYVYDGEGRRVKKTTGGSTVIFVYDAFGRLAAEYGGTAEAVGTEYLTADHLGSTRLITSSSGAERRCLDYLPFGEPMTQGMGGRGSCYASANEPRVKFTGKERDADTGLDYFGARYFSGAQGRFTSPDVPLADQWETEPQSWNLYSHVRNNPLRFIDPTGRKCVTLDNGTVGDDGQGKMCQAVLDAEKNKKPDVTVSAKGGNQVVAFALNLLFALDSAANSYFTPLTNAMGVRPSYMEPIPVTREFVGQLAAAVVTVGTAIIGPGGAQAPLKLIHSPATLSKTILDGLRKKSTQELIESLRPGLPEALRVKPDGRVMNGNHRLTVLMERGVDVNALPREVVP